MPVTLSGRGDLGQLQELGTNLVWNRCTPDEVGGKLDQGQGRRATGEDPALGLEETLVDALRVVVSAEYLGGLRIRLVFSDGIEGAVDFSEWLSGPVFEPSKDQAYFARFLIEGGTVSWPNGADIAPETLHERAKASQAAQPVASADRLGR